jgi:carboxylesterase
MGNIVPQAESFLLTGDKGIACPFINGFTASPSEVYPVARLIYQQTGYTVSGPLLPGHGCTPQEMNQTCWEDWFCRVEDEIDYLQRQHSRVFVAGLSMGGLLGLYAAGRRLDLRGTAGIFDRGERQAHLHRFRRNTGADAA